MTDFMDTALNYQPGIRVTPDAKRWVITNGIGQLPVCRVCAQPMQDGHVDCTCPKNHPENCDRPTYDQLKAQHDALVAALERLVDTVDVRASEFSTHSIQFQMSVTKAREALEQVK